MHFSLRAETFHGSRGDREGEREAARRRGGGAAEASEQTPSSRGRAAGRRERAARGHRRDAARPRRLLAADGEVGLAVKVYHKVNLALLGLTPVALAVDSTALSFPVDMGLAFAFPLHGTAPARHAGSEVVAAPPGTPDAGSPGDLA